METSEGAVALAAIGLAATAVGAIIYLAKYAVKELSADLQAHTKAAVEQTQASKEQKKASKEVLVFMKNLNGKLTNATIQKAQEYKDATE